MKGLVDTEETGDYNEVVRGADEIATYWRVQKEMFKKKYPALVQDYGGEVEEEDESGLKEEL